MAVGERERIAHVVRRLSMGANPELVARASGVDDAVTAALDLSAPAAAPLDLESPASYAESREVAEIAEPIGWWIERMASGSRLVEERLVWFWHDHFATSIAKVRSPYLMYGQHLTLRRHATANFADLLRAMATDPAMLFFLDGVTNRVDARNENFGRECLELFTLGIGGGYEQADVVAASRAFTGWVVNVPATRFTRDDIAPWAPYFAPSRHDSGGKTLLGVTGNHDLDRALDILLEAPATGRFVAGKLYRELVGLDADDETTARLGAAFSRDYEIRPLVDAIVAEPAFVSDAAVRTKARTPVEKLVGLLQATGGIAPPSRRGATGVGQALRALGYLPFVPPNVGGYPKGESLLGPHQLVHTFDLLAAVDPPSGPADRAEDVFARFGIFDLSERSRDVVAAETDARRQLALVLASPEFAVT